VEADKKVKMYIKPRHFESAHYAGILRPHHNAHTASIKRARLNAQQTGSIFRPNTREAMEFIERIHLASIASRSIGAGNRLIEEEPDKKRTAYYRDCGRIDNCATGRLLAGKTQVHANPLYPWVHNRDSHSQEVAQVGVSIGKGLGLNIDLIQAGGKAHDFGHAPFGHAGEAALDQLGKKYIDKDFIFKHNRQSARIVMYLEKYFNDKNKPGLNLTIEVIDILLHHCGELLTLELEPRKEPAYQRFLAAQRAGRPYKLSKEEMLEILDPSKDTLPALTYEGLVMALADREAYGPHDLEDALASGALVESKLSTSEAKRLREIRKILGDTPSAMMGTLINDTIDTSVKLNKVALSQTVGYGFQELQRFNTELICYSPEKVAFERTIYGKFEAIFLDLIEHYGKTPLEAIDHIAYMTDDQVDTEYAHVLINLQRL
jgi:dGTPase